MLDILSNGTGPIPEAANAGRSPYPHETFVSPVLDLTVPTLGIELIPARPGYFAVATSITWVIELVSGTQTSPANFRAGTDPSHLNFITANGRPLNTDVNGAVTPSVAVGGGLGAVTLPRTSGTTVIMDVTAGAVGTGNFALRGRLAVIARWIAEGGA